MKIILEYPNERIEYCNIPLGLGESIETVLDNVVSDTDVMKGAFEVGEE